MPESKVCPHCGGKMFMAEIIRGGLVEVNDDKENPYKIIKETKDSCKVKVVGCARCKAEITEADLIVGVACKECGKLVTPTELNPDGLCEVCAAQKERSELANASREDLIRMLLESEKKSSGVTAKIEKQIAKAEEITGAIDDLAVPTETIAPDELSEENTDDKNEEKDEKPRKRARRKKADTKENDSESTEDITDENSESTEEASEELAQTPSEAVEETSTEENNIASQQEAPFPDMMNLPEDNVQTAEPEVTNPVEEHPLEQPIGGGFEMFDQEEEPF